MLRALMLALTVLAVLPSAAMAARWERIALRGGPGDRVDHAMATAAGAVHLFGGRRAGRALGDLWRLERDGTRWRRVRTAGPRPAARFGANLVAERGGTLLLFGGQSGDLFFADTWRYDAEARRWSRVSAGGPAARYGAAGALDPASGALVVSHGFTTQGRFDDSWSVGAGPPTDLSPAAGATRPTPRCLLAGAVLGGGLWIYGGQSDGPSFLGDLWRFDLGNRTWRRAAAAAPPGLRNRYAAAQTTTSWYVHGGETSSGPRGDLWRLDDRGRFGRVPTTGRGPGLRAQHALAVAGRTLVLQGGAGANGERGDTWRLRLR